MDTILREQLISFLTTAQAHMTFSEAIKDFPLDRINEYPPRVDYTPWMLLDHIRFTQRDILNFLVDKSYKEPTWPNDYWPKKEMKATETMWKNTIDEYLNDLEQLTKLVSDKSVDLSAKVENGNGQVILREILLIIDHTSYHIGEFGILRQVMSTWSKSHE